VDLFDAIRARRSIRRYRADPVSEEKIERVLEAGRLAPSGANRQPWLFAVVRNPEIQAEIRRHAEEADRRWHDKAPEWLRRFFDRYEITPVKEFLTDVPALICVFGERGNPYWRESAWIAVGYMCLAAFAEGLATLTYTPGQTGYLNAILGVPARYSAIAILPIGLPAETVDPASRPRKPRGEVVIEPREWRRFEGTERGATAEHGMAYVPGLGDSRACLEGLLELVAMWKAGGEGLPARSSAILKKMVHADRVEFRREGEGFPVEWGGRRLGAILVERAAPPLSGMDQDVIRGFAEVLGLCLAGIQ
jgi:nitroreductase